MCANGSHSSDILRELDLLGEAVDGLLDDVQKADRLSTLRAELRDLLLGNWDAAAKEAIADALRELGALKGELAEADAQLVMDRLSDRLGTPFGEAVQAEVRDLSERIYGKGKLEILKPAGLKLSFNIVDRKAINSIARQSVYWIGEYWNEQLSGEISQVMQGALEKGLTREQTAELLKTTFDPIVEKGTRYWKGFANHVTTRARELGHVEGYVAAGVTHLEVLAVLDGRTTEICLRMHGRRIPVENAVKLRDALIGAKSPEDVKRIAPWVEGQNIKGKRTGDLATGLSLPPYHWGCRTTTVAVFDEPEAEALLSEKEIEARKLP